MIERIKNTRLYVGPVSRNVVEAVIEFVNTTGFSIGFTATVNHIGSNNYTGLSINDIKELPVCRDHCDNLPNRGTEKDFDIVHIDPWKGNNFYAVVDRTNEWLGFPYFYEVGTEEAVYPYGAKELDTFLSSVSNERVLYGVVQSGAKLQNGKNVGEYNELKLVQMIAVCKSYGLLSKEHNGDYLTGEIVKRKFELGVDAINIAPEFGSIESCIIWDALDRRGKDIFYSLCFSSLAWRKWISYDFDFSNKRELVRICGHYVFNHYIFKEMIRSRFDNIDKKIKNTIKSRLSELQTVIEEAV